MTMTIILILGGVVLGLILGILGTLFYISKDAKIVVLEAGMVITTKDFMESITKEVELLRNKIKDI